MDKLTKLTKRTLIMVGIFMWILVIITVIFSTMQKKEIDIVRASNFTDMFPELDNTDYCRIDGSYMWIDTKPDNGSDHSLNEAYTTIQAVNRVLEFPEQVYKSMWWTIGTDGTITKESDIAIVKWSYTEYTGLEVKYYLKAVR